MITTIRVVKNQPKLVDTQVCRVTPTSLIPSGDTSAQMKTATENTSAAAKTSFVVGNVLRVSSTLMPGTSAGWMDRSPEVAFCSALLTRREVYEPFSPMGSPSDCGQMNTSSLVKAVH
ncbi:hypothetical protein [Corynebacterium halotolerans]|uniref:hypothetical protein n=1 Tax=Corynebacterium halotolerans TaxID=225326 RepID=UPI003CF49233